ncbi:hypothetical protein JCM3765_004955 [Sporobolomyces pararoseus]
MPASRFPSKYPHSLLFIVALLSTPCLSASPDRTFTILNNCDFTLWPAITNYGTDKQQYTGVRGWEAEPGSSKELKVPSPWNGRIWARRDCQFDSDGNGSCTTGNVEGGLEPKDQTIGNVNVGEFNLDAWGGNDCWTVTMAVEPDPEDCQSVICADDLNDNCPDDKLKQKDSSGTVIGCLSACMAGVNAQDPSINCCSGKYNSKEACPSAQVDFYEVMKPYCQNAYWYPYDYQDNAPTVDWACPSSKNAAYKITFCPVGETTKSDSMIRAGGVTFVGDAAGTNTTGGDAIVEGSREAAAASSSRTNETGGGGVEPTSATNKSQSSSSSRASSYHLQASIQAPTAAASTKSPTASSASISTESTNESTIFGYPPSTVYLAAAILAILVVVIGFFACGCGHNRGGKGGGASRTREMRIAHIEKRRSNSISWSDGGTDSSSDAAEVEELRGDSGPKKWRARASSRDHGDSLVDGLRPLLYNSEECSQNRN